LQAALARAAPGSGGGNGGWDGDGSGDRGRDRSGDGPGQIFVVVDEAWAILSKERIQLNYCL
jgi:hypothetical protein